MPSALNIKVSSNDIIEDSSKDIFWSKIDFSSSDDKKTSSVLFCASKEYLEDRSFLKRNEEMVDKGASAWTNLVIKKWRTLNDEIFNERVHYDVYTNDPAAEVKGLNFLLKKTPYASSIL